MMVQLKKKTPSTMISNTINSPRKSDNGSVRSTSSLNKKNPTNKSNKKLAPPRKNSSVYDSDT